MMRSSNFNSRTGEDEKLADVLMWNSLVWVLIVYQNTCEKDKKIRRNGPSFGGQMSGARGQTEN